MNDYIIRLNNIKIQATHGLHEVEKTKSQIFEIDVAISFRRETCDDNIENSINYEYMYSTIVDIFKNNTFSLLETLGERIISSICKSEGVKSVSVTIRKPEIAFDDNHNCVEVSINSSNE